MLVKVLEVIHYPADGSHWKAHESHDPDWDSIEGAIRCLDRDEWPYVWLHTTDPVEGEMPENALCIMGGRGEYSLFLTKGGGEVNYLDESRSETPVRIWESDQGSVRREKDLCNGRGT